MSKFENVKPGDKIRVSNGTSESVMTLEVERLTKTQIVCLGKSGNKVKAAYALKFNRKTGRNVGDWIAPYFILSVEVKHTNTLTVNGVDYTAEVMTSYEAPKAGFEIHPGIFLKNDMKISFDWYFDKEARRYSVKPIFSAIDGEPVFYADGFSWRVTD